MPQYQLNPNPNAPLIYSEAQTRQILNTFYPNETQRIQHLDCKHDDVRRFAQTLLTTSVEASHGVSWAQSVFMVATGPSVKGAAGLTDLAKAGFEFSKNIYHPDIGDLKDVKIHQFVIDEVARTNKSYLGLLENDIALQKQQESEQRLAHYAKLTQELNQPTTTDKLVELARPHGSQAVELAKVIENPDKWQRLPENLAQNDGRFVVLANYFSSINQEFKGLSQDNQEKVIHMFAQHVNEKVAEREVNIASVRVDQGMDRGRS